jgi:hypothetical protein
MKYVAAILFGVLLILGWFCYDLKSQLEQKNIDLAKATVELEHQTEIIRWKTIYVPVRIETKTKEIMERKVGGDECESALQLLKDFQ